MLYELLIPGLSTEIVKLSDTERTVLLDRLCELNLAYELRSYQPRGWHSLGSLLQKLSRP